MHIKLDHMHIEPHGIRTMSKHQLYRPAMTIAVDLGRKATKTNKHQLRAELGKLGHLAAAT